jgi:ubiquinone/menaquinone biosynthesis C-methylase UbiE
MKSETFIPALSYDWLTPFYDLVVRLTTRERAFKAVLVDQSNVEHGHHVLDLACGTGTLAILLKQASPSAKVTAIDGDPTILDVAKKKAQRSRVDIEFDEGMSFSLPYKDRSFDRVLSSLFFHHLTSENKLKTLREVHRVLKPDGELHIADWGLPANLLMKATSRFVQVLDGKETTADSFGGLLPSLLQGAGFAAVEETGLFNTLLGTLRLHKALRRQTGE